MQTRKKEIWVDLGDRSYPIYAGTGLLSAIASLCEQHGLSKHIVIFTDRNVARLYLKPVERHLIRSGYHVVSFVVAPGESQKSLSNANRIFTAMLKAGAGRTSVVLALGGGVIGDLAGFVAATYHRGVPLVQVPTTLLSQVDSSVGGKTAVNHPMGKNMIGAFYQPRFVCADIDVLKTLPPREVLCGLGEIIKYGVILSEDLFSYLEEHLGRVLSLDEEAVLHVQESCLGLKAQLVSQDEKEETGVRMVLNYGHTIGHALEAAGKFRVLKHGEAVLLGMIAESFLAREIGLITDDIHTRIVRLILRVPLRYRKDLLRPSRVLKAMTLDKKAVAGKKRFVLPVQIGGTKVVTDLPANLIESSLHHTFQQEFSRR